MARKDRYNKNKPKVSPITLLIVGLVFLGLILTIVFSIKTPKQKFNDFLGTKEHVYKFSSVKKVEKEIANGNKVMVVFEMKDSENPNAALLNSLNDAYKKQEKFENDSATGIYAKADNKVSEHIEFVFYVKIKNVDALENLFEEYDEDDNINETFPMVLSFANKEFQTQHKALKDEDDLVEATEDDKLFRRTASFFKLTTKAFEEK